MTPSNKPLVTGGQLRRSRLADAFACGARSFPRWGRAPVVVLCLGLRPRHNGKALGSPVTIVDRPTWHLARHLLEEYEGAASELFVIDIPQDDLDRVLSLIATLPEVVADVCAGPSLEPPATLNEQLLARIAVCRRRTSLRVGTGTPVS